MTYRAHLRELINETTNSVDRATIVWAWARISKLEAALNDISAEVDDHGPKWSIESMAQDALKEGE